MRNKNLKIIFLMRILAAIIPMLSFAVIGSEAFAEHPRLLFGPEDIPALRAKANDTTTTLLGVSGQYIWSTIEGQISELKRNEYKDGELVFTYSVRIPAVEDGNVLIPAQDWSYTFSEQMPGSHDDPRYPPWTEVSKMIEVRVVYFALGYVVTGDPLYSGIAKDMMLKLAQWERWTDPYLLPERSACLDTAHLTRAVALAYDWLYNTLTEPERQAISDALKNKGLVNLAGWFDVNEDIPSNYREVLGSSLGLGSLALQQDFPADTDLTEWLTIATGAIKWDLDNQGDDGGTFEGPSYGTYGYDSIAVFLAALKKMGPGADPDHLLEHRTLKQLPRWMLSMLAPKGKVMRTFGDGNLLLGLPVLVQFLSLREDATATDAQYYLSQVGWKSQAFLLHDIVTFILLNNAQHTLAKPTFNPSGIFKDIGYGVLRGNLESDAPALYFKCGPPTQYVGHNHFDQNSFVIYYQKKWLIAESAGYRAFDTKKDKFIVGSIGHNTIILDENEYPDYLNDNERSLPFIGHEQKTLTDGAIAKSFSSPVYDFINGDATETYNKERLYVDREYKLINRTDTIDKFERSILYLKPDYFVTYDTLESPLLHSFCFLLHGLSPELYRQGVLFEQDSRALYAQVLSPNLNSSEVISYTELEQYGKFFIARTSPVTSTTFASVLYPGEYSVLLRNPGFETDLNNWSLYERCTALYRIDDTVAHSGSKSARIDVQGRDKGFVSSDMFALPTGSNITVHGFVKMNITSGRVYLMLRYYDENGNQISQTQGGMIYYYDPQNIWTELTVTDIVPDGAIGIRIWLSFDYYAEGTVWFDDINVESPQWQPSPSPLDMLNIEGLDGGRDGLVVNTDKGRDIILFNPGNTMRTFSVGPDKVTTDGEMAVIRRDTNGILTSTVLQQGRILKFNDADLITPLNENATIATEYVNGKPKYISAATSIARENGINQPPILNPIGDKTINEGNTLSFSVDTVDYNGDNLNYSATNLPQGASFNQNTHTFTWTPTSAQGGEYSTVFTVSDGTLSKSEVINITVSDTLHPPEVGNISPSNGSSKADIPCTFTTTFSDQDGEQDIKYGLFLVSADYEPGKTIKNCFDGYYNQNEKKLYLLSADGTAWLGGFAPGSANVIENGYAELDCSQTTVSGSGNNTLTIQWRVTFKKEFAGTQTKNMYLCARDNSGASTGFQEKGTWLIGENIGPSVGIINPGSGGSFPNTPVTFTTTFIDPNGWKDIKYGLFLVNTNSTDKKNCFDGYYDQNANKLFLLSKDASSWLGGFAPGSENVIDNGYAKLDCSQTTVSGSGETLTIQWRVVFTQAFAGTQPKKMYLCASDDSNVSTGFQQRGMWFVGIGIKSKPMPK